MLIEINLAPASARSSRAVRLRPHLSLPALPSLRGGGRRALIALGGLLLMLAPAYRLWSVAQQKAELQARIEEQVTDSIGYAVTIDLLRQVQAQRDTVAQKIAVIRSVDTRRYIWPHLLDEIALAVPPYTWLTQISAIDPVAAGEEETPSFIIQGNVGSTPALTRFMKNLEASAFIRDVALITTEQEIVEGRTIQRFGLQARYRVPEPFWIETVPVIALD